MKYIQTINCECGRKHVVEVKTHVKVLSDGNRNDSNDAKCSKCGDKFRENDYRNYGKRDLEEAIRKGQAIYCVNCDMDMAMGWDESRSV